MVKTFKEAKIGETYRIRDIVNMSVHVSERLRKIGVISGAKIVLIDKTTYGRYLFQAIHPNGELIKSSVTEQEAERIHIEDPNNISFTVIQVEDGK